MDEEFEKKGDASEEPVEELFDSEAIEKESHSNELEIEDKSVSENIDNKDVDNIHENQLRWAVILMAGIILILVVVPFVKINFLDKFDYHGLTFQKTQLGEIEFYSTKFPVVGTTGNVIGNYAVNLRSDPREIEGINVTATLDTIDFRFHKEQGKIKYDPVYISLDPDMDVCEDSTIAILTVSGFLKDSGLEVRSASMNKTYAEANNVTYKRCAEDSSVIMITQGHENKITEIGDVCYEIRFKDCDILKVSERFVLKMLEQYGDAFDLQ